MKKNKPLFLISGILLVFASAFVPKSKAKYGFLYTRAQGTDVTDILANDCFNGGGPVCTIGATQVVTMPGGNVVGHTAFKFFF